MKHVATTDFNVCIQKTISILKEGVEDRIIIQCVKIMMLRYVHNIPVAENEEVLEVTFTEMSKPMQMFIQ